MSRCACTIDSFLGVIGSPWKIDSNFSFAGDNRILGLTTHKYTILFEIFVLFSLDFAFKKKEGCDEPVMIKRKDVIAS